jgi:hypothetical protein
MASASRWRAEAEPLASVHLPLALPPRFKPRSPSSPNPSPQFFPFLHSCHLLLLPQRRPPSNPPPMVSLPSIPCTHDFPPPSSTHSGLYPAVSSPCRPPRRQLTLAAVVPCRAVIPATVLYLRATSEPRRLASIPVHPCPVPCSPFPAPNRPPLSARSQPCRGRARGALWLRAGRG